MQVGEQLSVELERGKELSIGLVVIGELNDKGERRLFFGLDGQPRVIAVVERAAKANAAAIRLADESDPGQIAAPMPGMVSVVSVKLGDRVEAGDRLMSLEAMKMETAIAAPHGGTVADLPVKASPHRFTPRWLNAAGSIHRVSAQPLLAGLRHPC